MSLIQRQALVVGENGIAGGEDGSFRRGIALVIAAGLLIRLVALWMIACAPLAADSTDYRGMALLLLGGERFVPYWPPGLSLYLAPFLAAGGGDVVLRAAMLAWWGLFCFGLVRLAADLKIGKKACIALLTIFSVTPALIHFSIEPMTQMPSAALLLVAMSAVVRCSERAGWGEALLMGGALGWLSLVRPSALPLLLVLPGLIFLRRKQVAQPVVAVALGAAMIFAWVVKVHQLSGQWTINNSNGVNLYYGNNPWTPMYRTWYFGSHAKLGSDEIRQFPEYEAIVQRVQELPATARGDEFKRLAVEYVKQRPGVFLLRTVNRVRCFWGFDIFTAANLRAARSRWFPAALGMDALCYLIVAGYAFFWVAAAPAGFWRLWETWLLGAVVLLYSAPYWISMSHPTYHFPVVAPLALMGVVAYELVRREGVAVRWRGWVSLAVLGLIQVEWMFYLAKS